MLGSCVKAVAVGKVDGNEAAGGKKINEKKVWWCRPKLNQCHETIIKLVSLWGDICDEYKDLILLLFGSFTFFSIKRLHMQS